MKKVRVFFVLLLAHNTQLWGQTDPTKSPQAFRKCEQQLYGGLDSRLEPRVVGALPKTKEPVVGFELVNHVPMLAFPHQLLGFQRSAISGLDVSSKIIGISVSNRSGLVVQTDRGIETVGETELKLDPILSGSVHGHLYGSGNAIFVEARSKADLIQFVARNQKGSYVFIGSFKGKFRTASWNEIGLAAIIDDSLYIWEAGSKQILRLFTDKGLELAKDVALVGPSRAVVVLSATVVLVTTETLTVLAGMQAERCRFEDGILYVLDDGRRLIWAFRGIDKLGTKVGDKNYAMELLKHVPETEGEQSNLFLEAARIVGCEQARHVLAQQMNAPKQ